ncbi:MAG TPA: lyase family protein, partial [Gammaproteobacteria bacterium]
MSNETTVEKPWTGRFTEPTDAFVEAFGAAVGFDQRMYRQDIQGSIAHARMLAHVGVLTNEERDSIIAGLSQIREEIEGGAVEWSIALEDVHMNIEKRLTDRIGIAGKKLHTGRSRNDQVATDVRLYLRDEIDVIAQELKRLQANILDHAAREADTLMPGFTHLQTAQPITFGHHLLAWNEMLQRDSERLQDCRKRV